MSRLLIQPAKGNSDFVTITLIAPAVVADAFQREAIPLIERIEDTLTDTEFDLATWDSSVFTAPHNARHRGSEHAWNLPTITEHDVRAVAWAVDQWTATGRSLAAGLLLNPAGIRTSDLADLVGFTGGIAPALRGIASRLRSIDRQPFWLGYPTDTGHERGKRLWIDKDSAGYQLLRSIYNARYPNLLADPTIRR